MKKIKEMIEDMEEYVKSKDWLSAAYRAEKIADVDKKNRKKYLKLAINYYSKEVNSSTDLKANARVFEKYIFRCYEKLKDKEGMKKALLNAIRYYLKDVEYWLNGENVEDYFILDGINNLKICMEKYKDVK